MVTEDDIEAFREMNAGGFIAIHKMIRLEEQGLDIKRYFSEEQLRMAARGARAMAVIIGWQDEMILHESLAPK